jgi:hypothetical protein
MDRKRDSPSAPPVPDVVSRLGTPLAAQIAEAPPPLEPEHVLELQRTAGNRLTTRALQARSGEPAPPGRPAV